MKIRSHLLILVVAAVLPIVAFSAIMTVVFWREQRHAFEQRYLDRVRAMAIALDRELDGSIRSLQVCLNLRISNRGISGAFISMPSGRWRCKLRGPTLFSLMPKPASPPKEPTSTKDLRGNGFTPATVALNSPAGRWRRVFRKKEWRRLYANRRF